MSNRKMKLLGVLCSAFLAGCSISGGITTAGSGLDGVTVKLEGPAQRTATTSGDGSYAFKQLLSTGTYTVTPSKPAHEMTPPSRQVRINRFFQHVSGVDFSAKKLDPVVAPVLGNMTATDLQNDGTFDTINTATPVEARSTRVTYLNRYETKRAVFEFDLSGVSPSVPVRSAILEFTVIGYGNGPGGVQLDFWGYKGDGLLNLADAVAGDSIVRSIVISSTGVKQIDLKDFVQQLVNTGSFIAGLNIRTHNEAATSSVDEHCYIPGYQATSSLFPGPRLTIDY